MSRNKPRDKKACWPVRCAECWPVAVILVLACAAGAWFMWLHWQGQLWSDRAAELGGPTLQSGYSSAGRGGDRR